MNRKLNLFIVGAAKSGSTSLWRYLQNHSQVFMPEKMVHKEPAYFSELKAGLPRDEYFGLFADAAEQHVYIGEASTAYLTDPVSASRIYDHNADARIVIMLRNPIDRAYSLYKWMTQEGYEYARDFATALKLEPKREHSTIPNSVEIEYYYNYLYAKSGLYSGQVKRYLDRFAENVWIMCFENFCINPDSELRKLCDFLNIRHEEIALVRENASMPVYHPALQHRLRLLTMFLVRKRLLPRSSKSKRDVLMRLGIKPFSKHPPMAESTRAQLKAYFCDDIAALSDMTGIDFPERWNQ